MVCWQRAANKSYPLIQIWMSMTINTDFSAIYTKTCLLWKSDQLLEFQNRWISQNKNSAVIEKEESIQHKWCRIYNYFLQFQSLHFILPASSEWVDGQELVQGKSSCSKNLFQVSPTYPETLNKTPAYNMGKQDSCFISTWHFLFMLPYEPAMCSSQAFGAHQQDRESECNVESLSEGCIVCLH